MRDARLVGVCGKFSFGLSEEYGGSSYGDRLVRCGSLILASRRIWRRNGYQATVQTMGILALFECGRHLASSA